MGSFKTAAALLAAAVLAVGAGGAAAYADDAGASICSVPTSTTTPVESQADTGCWEIPTQQNAHMGGM
jgi:mannose/cellobiose epimerase-like protein (N-acyl-D-glucosamine 2-epimerase family)